MTKEEAKRIVEVAFDVPQAVRRIGEDRTYHEDEIREAKNMAIKALEDQEPKPKIFKTTSFTLKPEDMEKYRREIVRQMEEGIVLLPNCIELVEDKSDLLDKIREEIEQEYNRLNSTRADETLELGECLGLKMSLKIIDKYRQEG